MRLAVFSSPFGRALTIMIVTVLVTVPYTRVIDAEMMIVEAILTAVALVLIAVLVRGLTHKSRGAGRLPLTIAAQLCVLLLLVTARGFTRTAAFGFVPRLSTLLEIASAVRDAIRQIVTGVAPMPETLQLHVLFIIGIGAYAIAMYALLVWSRSPIPASALTAIVAALPSIVVGFAPSPVWFVALAVSVLVMFWQCGRGLGKKRVAGLGAAVTIGASAIIAAVFISQFALSGVVPVSGSGGGGYEIDASLDLGQDLRRPNPVTALTYVTNGDAPYLRVATLSAFHENEWQPDTGVAAPLSNPIPSRVAEEMLAEPFSLSVKMERATGTMLPIPYIPRTVEGLGQQWAMNLDNHTVTGHITEGQTYVVDYQTVNPTIDALRAVNVGEGPTDPTAFPLPSSGTPLTTQISHEFLFMEPTQIDALLALERWFRTEFTYSLEPPIADTANLEVIEAFLQVRSGYCVHFASAFALMARDMGLPSRVVVGFLPGEQTGTTADGARYRVSTDRLHSWPEVYFGEYGWIPFEPTATLGTETEFVAADENGSEDVEEEPGETAEDPLDDAETPEQREQPETVEPEMGEDAGASDAPREMNWPLFAIVCVVILLCVPAVLRTIQRIRRTRAARRGDALAAWNELTATVSDLGIAPDDTLTPRKLAEHLRVKYFVDGAALDALVTEVEQAAYAPADHPLRRGGTALGPVMRDLRRNMGWWLWGRSLFFPRSLSVALQQKILKNV